MNEKQSDAMFTALLPKGEHFHSAYKGLDNGIEYSAVHVGRKLGVRYLMDIVLKYIKEMYNLEHDFGFQKVKTEIETEHSVYHKPLKVLEWCGESGCARFSVSVIRQKLRADLFCTSIQVIITEDEEDEEDDFEEEVVFCDGNDDAEGMKTTTSSTN